MNVFFQSNYPPRRGFFCWYILDSDNPDQAQTTHVCRTWCLLLGFAQGLCLSLEFFLVLTNVPCKKSLRKLQAFPENQDNGCHKLLCFSIYPCCSWKELWFHWAWALCRGWCGLWFLQGTFLHCLSSWEKATVKSNSSFSGSCFSEELLSVAVIRGSCSQVSLPTRWPEQGDSSLEFPDPSSSPIALPFWVSSIFALSVGAISLSWLFPLVWSLGTHGVSLWPP